MFNFNYDSYVAELNITNIVITYNIWIKLIILIWHTHVPKILMSNMV